MKTLVREALQSLGCAVEVVSNEELEVSCSEGSGVQRLLGSGLHHRLGFSTGGRAKDGVQVVIPGGHLLEGISNELAQNGSVRHRLLEPLVPFKRKEIKNYYRLFAGKVNRFSARSSWLTTVVCYVKITLIGEDLVEELVCMEVPPAGAPVHKKDGPLPEMKGRWVDRSPLKKYQMEDRLQKAMTFAERLAFERAEDARGEVLEHLYQTLDRLRRYYQQVKEEAHQQEAVSAAEREYERRKSEEVAHARIRAKVKMVAVETVSAPCKHLTWELERDGDGRTIQAVFDMMNAKMATPVRCEVCNLEVTAFGLSGTGKIVCSDCYANCTLCGVDVVGRKAGDAFRCSTCGKTVCDEHAKECSVCKARVCHEHVIQCEEGCLVCENCARHCPECAEDVVWCRDHVITNSKGYVMCERHAFYCTICREPHPSRLSGICAFCGQMTCRNCMEWCPECDLGYCRNHFEEGRCVGCCSRTRERRKPYQMRLF